MEIHSHPDALDTALPFPSAPTTLLLILRALIK